ncbi:hypothetical protein cypCar_00032165, partial [Cyprinus carpio]
MFLNKMKEQLGPDKGTAFPHSSAAHYPTAVLTVPGSVAMDTGTIGRLPKQEGGGGAAGLVITTPQGALVTPSASSQSFVSGPPTTTMIVSALHPTNTEAVRPPSLYLHSH